MSRYYFAYASNLDAAQMERRCPGLQYRGKAFLPKHRLAFTHMSTTWGGGSADILEDMDSPGVWGAVYELTLDDWKRLGEAEGSPYKRVTVTVWEAGVEERDELGEATLHGVDVPAVKSVHPAVLKEMIGAGRDDLEGVGAADGAVELERAEEADDE